MSDDAVKKAMARQMADAIAMKLLVGQLIAALAKKGLLAPNEISEVFDGALATLRGAPIMNPLVLAEAESFLLRHKPTQ